MTLTFHLMGMEIEIGRRQVKLNINQWKNRKPYKSLRKGNTTFLFSIQYVQKRLDDGKFYFLPLE